MLAIPGTNAPVERAFSLMNSYWSDEKSQLSEETLEAVMRVKVNMEETCVEFYNRILTDNNILRRIQASDKYDRVVWSICKFGIKLMLASSGTNF